jgi:hypothetical protein
MELFRSLFLTIHNLICDLFFGGDAPSWLQSLHTALGIGKDFTW